MKLDKNSLLLDVNIYVSIKVEVHCFITRRILSFTRAEAIKFLKIIS